MNTARHKNSGMDQVDKRKDTSGRAMHGLVTTFELSVFFMALVMLLVGLMSNTMNSINANAATCTSTAAGGNWNALTTWTGSCAGGGGIPANTPGAADVVVISGVTATVTIPAGSSVAASSVTMASGASNTTLTLANASSVLSIGKNLDIYPGTANNRTKQLTVLLGTLNVGGNVTLTGGTAATRKALLSASTGKINITGNLTVNPVAAATAATVLLTGAGIITVSGVSGVSNGDTLTLGTGTLKVTNAAATLLNSNASAVAAITVSSGVLNVAGNLTNASAETITVSTTGNVTVGGALINSGTMTLTAAGKINAASNVSNAGTLTLGTGTLNATNAAATFLNSNASAVAAITMSSGVLNVAGNLTNAAAETITVSTTGNVTVGGALTNSGTIALTTTGKVNAASGVSNAGTLTIGAGTFNAANAAATFLNSNASAVAATTVSSGMLNVVGNLTNAVAETLTVSTTGRINVSGALANSGTITLTAGGAVSAVGAFTNAASGVFTNTAAGNLFVGSDMTQNGTFTAGTGTVTFNGTGAQALGGSAATIFRNLTINKASGDVTIISATSAVSPTVNGALTLTNGHVITSATNDLGLGTAATAAASGVSAVNPSWVIGNVQKNYAAAGTLTFPVGDASNYTPVVITGTAGFTAGSLTINASSVGDHPSIALSDINSGASVNRYWTLTSAVLPATSVYTATFNFPSGVVDAGATPANFIVERWDGSSWFPTISAVACTATPATNLCSQITSESGFGAFAIGTPVAGYTPPVLGQFNAFETTTPTGAVQGKILTKLAGTPFSLRLVHLLNNAVDTAYAQAGVTVELLDTSDNTGLRSATTGCRPVGAAVGQWHVIPGTTQVVTFAAGVATATFSAAMLANVYKDARAHVIYAGNPVPNRGEGCSTDRFALRPAAFLVTQSTPTLNAGSAFTLTTKAVATDLATATSNYIDVPPLNLSQITGVPNFNSAVLAPQVLSVAASGVSTTTFTYDDVGSFTLPVASGVSDSTFTSTADGSIDCVVGSASNIADATGKYGCLIGQSAALTVGAFIPDHFEITTSPAFAAGCNAGGFTYMGQSFTPSGYTITAKSKNRVSPEPNLPGNVALKQYSGGKFYLAAINGTADALSRLSPAVTNPLTPTWVNGSATQAATSYTFTRPITTTADATWGNFDTLDIGVSVDDPNGIGYSAATSTFTATTPATCTSGTACQSYARLTGAGATKMRFGRIKLSNAAGSELLNLSLPMEVQYWNGTAWMQNSLDSCTSIGLNNIKSSNANVTPASVTPVAGNSGKWNVVLNKPATAPALPVNADVCVDLDSSVAPVDATCTGAAPFAAFTYLQTGASFNKDPSSRATFGVYQGRKQFIYMRENY